MTFTDGTWTWDHSDEGVSPIYRTIAVSVVLSRITEKSRSTTKTGKNPERVFLFMV
jgi:hypothetical protein